MSASGAVKAPVAHLHHDPDSSISRVWQALLLARASGHVIVSQLFPPVTYSKITVNNSMSGVPKRATLISHGHSSGSRHHVGHQCSALPLPTLPSLLSLPGYPGEPHSGPAPCSPTCSVPNVNMLKCQFCCQVLHLCADL